MAATAQDRCEFREVTELNGPAPRQLEVSAGAGTLTITGKSGLGQVRVTATLCASSQNLLEQLTVSLDGDQLEARYPERRGYRTQRSYARIDLDVELPAGTNVDVEDGSGSATISGTGDIRIQDGSGSLVLNDVGAVAINDGSGSLEVTGVAGDIEINDGSGSLDIRDVTGSVEVDDGSGSLEIFDVSGDVVVSDGSGQINIETVGGSVRIKDGNGGVSVSDVEGDLTVSGGRRERIRYANIRGELDLPAARRRGRGN